MKGKFYMDQGRKDRDAGKRALPELFCELNFDNGVQYGQPDVNITQDEMEKYQSNLREVMRALLFSAPGGRVKPANSGIELYYN